MPYRPNRGGHAPSDLREALRNYLDLANGEETLVEVGEDEEGRPIKWLIGQLWNCSDVMPGSYCLDVDLPRGSSYAQAVRKLAKDLA